ncbi:conserved hypothetical protein [Deferribacter desulfuricans SSM1]|uniref:histidine kinase n=1 Tax=Deferribacter desulfuricans (strain DSM 14783 / JCM 11476 / NBRC 101012 / SSM1) TaxID=639282 RepID=D3P9M5_DEFDS|nr:ATP-binding protein [Deferribacter desulfuricans]BAI81415.1 conserved hypothetical protein [Deferribacter desulfuricans SSM1]
MDFSVFDNFNDPVVITDLEFNKVYANESFIKIKIGDELFDKSVKIYKQTGKSLLDVHVDRSNFRVKVSPYKDNLIFVFEDRSNINQFVEKFFTLNSIINQAPVGIIITDKDGNIKFVNNGFEKMTGFTFNEVCGENPRIWKSGEHSREFYKHLWDTILSGRKWVGEFKNKKKDGTFYMDRSVIFPIVDSNGEIIEFCGIKQDITEMKRLEKNLIQNEKNITLGRFVDNIAHDLKNMLTGIFSICDYLKSKTLSEDIKCMVEQIYKYTKVMDEFISTMRNVGNKKDIIDIDFCRYLSENKDFYRRIIGKNIKIDVQCDCHCCGFMSKTHLDQIFLNLLVNARDAIMEKYEDGNGGLITIKINCISENIFIEVTDNGNGIPDDIIDKIFSLSFTTKDEGTGVGLFIVKSIVEQYGGSIEVESGLNKGTTFKVKLPVLDKVCSCD